MTARQPIRNCQPDEMPLMGLKECTNNYGVTQSADEPGDPYDPNHEWPNNCLSIYTIAYTCGKIGRQGETLDHNHDPDEIDRCQHWAMAAAEIMDGIEVGLGSEASDVFFTPFYIAANLDQLVPEQLTEAYLRDAFGGTIYPPTEIKISSLDDGHCWDLLDDDYEGYVKAKADGDTETLAEFSPDECAEFDQGIAAWNALIDWFGQNQDLHSPSLVEIGEEELSDHNMGCVFPRLIVGLTAAGSLAGVAGYIVQT
ncbi:MAG: hypothetical protein AAF728_03190 [Cyanobacteria bacterium P01_D01_bin.128]